MSDQVRTIQVPYYMVKTVNKLVRTQRRLLQEYGREPTPKEIALEMGQLSSEDIQAIKEALANNQHLDLDIERRWWRVTSKVRRIIGITQEPMSPETPTVLEERSIAGSIKGGAKFEPVGAALQQLEEQLLGVLDSLSERERKVLEMRFGTMRKLSTPDRARKSQEV